MRFLDDRRFLYLLLGLTLLVPSVLNLPIKLPEEDISPSVKKAYEFIENLPDSCRVLFSVDYGPSSYPETHPMVVAVSRHLYRKGCKIATMTLWSFQGILMGNKAMEDVSRKMGREYGKDWVNLGFKPGIAAVLKDIGIDFKGVFPKEITHNKTLDQIDFLKDVKTVKDFDLVVVFAAGATADFWVQITGAEYKVPIIVGSTAVIAPAFYVFLQSGQIEGLIGGLKGAADYETLVKSPDMATMGMLAQTFGHWLIILFIFIGNLLFVLRRYRIR